MNPQVKLKKLQDVNHTFLFIMKHKYYHFICLILLFTFSSNTSNAQSNIDSQKAETVGPENGTLLIIGGGASDMFYTKFMALVGGKDAPIVVIPTAASSATAVSPAAISAIMPPSLSDTGVLGTSPIMAAGS